MQNKLGKEVCEEEMWAKLLCRTLSMIFHLVNPVHAYKAVWSFSVSYWLCRELLWNSAVANDATAKLVYDCTF